MTHKNVYASGRNATAFLDRSRFREAVGKTNTAPFPPPATKLKELHCICTWGCIANNNKAVRYQVRCHFQNNSSLKLGQSTRVKSPRAPAHRPEVGAAARAARTAKRPFSASHQNLCSPKK